MPGTTTHAAAYEMELTDALAILSLQGCVAELYASHEELRALRDAARHVVEASAVDVIRRYAKPEPTAPSLRIVKSGEHNNGTS